MSASSLPPGEPARHNSGSGSESASTPRQVTNVAVLAESELGSEAQRERRKRILDATLAIASKGGYEAVQMRAVAERADVAVGTLYRYFPSKVHLLVSALAREFERIDSKTDRSVVAGGSPFHRLSFMVSKLNRAMQRNPLLTEDLWTKIWELDRLEEMQLHSLGLIDLLAWDIKSRKAVTVASRKYAWGKSLPAGIMPRPEGQRGGDRYAGMVKMNTSSGGAKIIQLENHFHIQGTMDTRTQRQISRAVGDGVTRFQRDP